MKSASVPHADRMKHILVDMHRDPAGWQRLQAVPDISVSPVEPQEGARRLPTELIRDQHVLFCTNPPTNLDDLASLELLQISTAGFNHLPGRWLADLGVRVCNARGVFETAIAEWNVAMMINLARDLRGMIRNQEQAVWDHAVRFQMEIRGQTLGIWGYGGIGRETARLAKALGLRVHVLSRSPIGPRTDSYSVPGTGDPQGVLPDRVFRDDERLAFLADLDFLVLAMPLSKTNEGTIGESELRALPRRAFVLNPARGALIQEQALLAALREGWIAGAALDTHYYYPMPPEHPLWRFSNVILTPHISGGGDGPHFRSRIWEVFTANVTRYLAGTPLLNEVAAADLRDLPEKR